MFLACAAQSVLGNGATPAFPGCSPGVPDTALLRTAASRVPDPSRSLLASHHLLPVPGSSGYVSDSGASTTTSISTGRLGGGGGHAPSPSYPAGHIGVSDDEGGWVLGVLGECVVPSCSSLRLHWLSWLAAQGVAEGEAAKLSNHPPPHLRQHAPALNRRTLKHAMVCSLASSAQPKPHVPPCSQASGHTWRTGTP